MPNVAAVKHEDESGNKLLLLSFGELLWQVTLGIQYEKLPSGKRTLPHILPDTLSSALYFFRCRRSYAFNFFGREIMLAGRGEGAGIYRRIVLPALLAAEADGRAMWWKEVGEASDVPSIFVDFLRRNNVPVPAICGRYRLRRVGEACLPQLIATWVEANKIPLIPIMRHADRPW